MPGAIFLLTRSNDILDFENENIDCNFSYDSYSSLSTNKEKMRYIYLYSIISVEDIKKLNESILDELFACTHEDPGISLMAMIILMRYGIAFPLQGRIEEFIFGTIIYDDMFENALNILNQYRMNYNTSVSIENINMLCIKYISDPIPKNANLLKFISNMIKFHNFVFPLEYFIEITNQINDMSYKEKKIFSRHMLFDYGNNQKYYTNFTPKK